MIGLYNWIFATCLECMFLELLTVTPVFNSITSTSLNVKSSYRFLKTQFPSNSLFGMSFWNVCQSLYKYDEQSGSPWHLDVHKNSVISITGDPLVGPVHNFAHIMLIENTMILKMIFEFFIIEFMIQYFNISVRIKNYSNYLMGFCLTIIFIIDWAEPDSPLINFRSA